MNVKKAESSWFLVHRPNPRARLRLFCFPYSGSGAFGFRTWADHLPSEVEVCAVQLPGRENRLREPLHTSLPRLIEELMRVMPEKLDRPCALFGHSLGALIAFEVARALRHEHRVLPVHLFASARSAPQRPAREEPLYRLSDDAFLEGLKRFNGTTEATLANAELMELFLPILRADFELNEAYAYRPEAPLDCPITAFHGIRDGIVSYVEAAAWREQTTRAFALRTLPGDHFFIHSAQRLLWQYLSEDLNSALHSPPAIGVLGPATSAFPHQPAAGGASRARQA